MSDREMVGARTNGDANRCVSPWAANLGGLTEPGTRHDDGSRKDPVIGEVIRPQSDTSIPEIADGLFVARAEVAHWTVEPSSHRSLTRLLDCDYARWRDSRSEEFRARFAATRHFAKSAVARVAGLPVEDIELRRSRSGRPSFVARSSRCSRVVDANLSHTHDSAVMAVSTRGPVGVDVEAHDRNLDRADFARAICHDEELRVYQQRPPAERQRFLLELWTWKEATTKAMGTGLRTPFPTLCADIPSGTVTDGDAKTWQIHAFTRGGYRVVIASDEADASADRAHGRSTPIRPRAELPERAPAAAGPRSTHRHPTTHV